jgi:hypothetical protein
MNFPTKRLSRLAPYVWFVALAAAVLGPLLLPGYLLLLDAPAGPNPNWPSLLPTPSEGQVAQAGPALTVHQLFGLIHPQLSNKLVVGLIVVVGGVGMYRFLSGPVGLRRSAAIVGGTFFVVNPFVYDRLLAGQILLALGYALLSWALPSWLRTIQNGNRSDALRGLGWCAVITAVDIHFGGMAFLLLLLAIGFSPASWMAKAVLVAVAILGILLINAYWLIPSVLTEAAGRLGTGDFRAYAPRPRSARILPTVLALHGFWRLEFPTPLSISPARFWAAFAPLAGAGFYGLLRAAGSRKWWRPATALGIACVIAIVLGMGRSFPLTAPVARWLFSNFPGYGIYREPQKWIGVLGLGYAVFVAVGADGVASLLDRLRDKLGTVIVLAAALPLVATSTMLWGFSGTVQNSQFPADWTRAEDASTGEAGSLMVMPWNHYQPLPFAGFRTIGNPAHHFFSTRAVISDDAQLFVRNETPPADPRDIYVDKLLRNRRRISNFGHLVAPLGVHFVALAHVADWRGYGFLENQPDLRTVFAGEELTLYENTAWTGSLYELEREGTPFSLRDLLNSAEGEENVASNLLTLESSAALKPLPGPDIVEGLPGWDRIQASDAPVVGTDKSCHDGWRLGPEEPVCHLGALAAFRSPGTDVHLWRPGIALQLGAYLLSLLAVVALLIAVRWTARTNEKTPRTEWGSSPTSDGR